MAEIFISYSRSDKQFLDNFVPLLRKVYGNDSLWFDYDIKGGSNWWKIILNRIEECSLFLYLISNESLESTYCQAELREALRLHKPILPVVVRRLRPPYPGTVPDDLSDVLRHIQYIDMAEGFRDALTIASLYAAINELLESESDEKPEPATDYPVPQPPVQDKKSWRSRLNESQRIIIAAVITGIFAVSFAFIALTPKIPDASADITGETEDTATQNAINTEAAQAAIDGTSTAIAPFAVAEEGVTSNDEWIPYIQEFQSVPMVLVPKGCFEMGSLSAEGDERPPHQVCFEQPFWIDRFEVSNAQFAQFNTNETIRDSRWTDVDLPRNRITWYEAVDFCEARDARLPTEAEWEYTARGVDAKIYPWGNEFSGTVVNFCDTNCASGWHDNASNDGYEYTASVDSLIRGISWVGAYQMSGNVAEWTSTIYSHQEFPYPYKDNDGREDITRTNVRRVVRGGSWFLEPASLRAANRSFDTPLNQSNYTGIRCVRDYDG
jgi:formylglycine-generating enzyme required for sulfatase activity